MKVHKAVIVPIGKLHLDPRNARIHGKESIRTITASLKAHGQAKNIVALRDGKVIAGNGTLMAAKALGATELAVVYFDNEKDAVAFAISDNRTAEMSTWDETMLAEVLHGLQGQGRDLNDLGFTPSQFSELMDGIRPNGDQDADQVPDLPKKPVSKPGQVWALGDHRLMCGDGTDPKHVARLLGQDAKARMVFTDPPYNVDYGANKTHTSHKIRSIVNDKQSPAAWVAFNQALVGILQGFCTGDLYVWGASGPEGMRQRLQFVDAGIHWSATIIWKKNSLVLSPANYQRIYEPCFYGWNGKSSFGTDRTKVEVWEIDRPTFEMPKARKETAIRKLTKDKDAPARFFGFEGTAQMVTGTLEMEVWEIDRPSKSDLHPTMKPVALCRRGIENSSRQGDTVLDAFGGSGSTLLACEETGRACRMMELLPGYVDVILERWQQFTGKKARLLEAR